MTLLVVDKFKDKVYIFSDGRVTAGMQIITDTYLKQVTLFDDNVMAFAGHLGTLEIGKQLYGLKELTLDSLGSFPGSGTLILVDYYGVVEYTFDDGSEIKEGESRSVNTVAEFSHDVGAMCFGIDGSIFRSVYKALKIGQSTTQTQYINRVREAFKIVSSVHCGVGKLYKFDIIEVY